MRVSQRRDLAVSDLKESDGIFSIAFSSETPVVRSYETERGEIELKEVLSHDEGAADLSRLNNNASLLFNHDFDNHLGIIIPNSVRIDSDRVGRADVRFSEHGQLAIDVKGKVEEKTITKISFGYDVDEYEIDYENETLLVTKWSPYEISFVTVPADDTVGLNRTKLLNTSVKQISTRKKTMKKIREMSEVELVELTAEEIEALSAEERAEYDEAIEALEVAQEEEARQKREGEVEDEDKETDEARQKREEDEDEIIATAERFKVPSATALKAIRSGMTAVEFKRSIKPNKSIQVRKMAKDTQQTLEKRFSLDNVSRALASGKSLRGVEAEYHQEMARKALARGRVARSNGSFIPASALRAASAGNTTANLAKITDEVVRYDSFVDLLMEKSILGQLNVNVLSGLKNPTAIPRMTKTSTDSFGFVSEDGRSPEGKSEFDNVPMTPRTFTGGNPISRQAMLTVPDIGSFIADHIVKASRIKLEKMIFSAVANTNARDGIVKLLVDADRVQKGELSYKAFLKAVAELTDNGADAEAIKFVMRGATAADLKSTLRDSNVHDYIITDDNKLGGNDVISSGVIGEGSVIAGDFSGITIAEWEGLELDLDNTTYRDSDSLVPRIWCDLDWAVTNPDAMIVMQPAGAEAKSKA